MSDKDVLRKLVKIAENQQKIINKLAQGLSGSPDGGVITTNSADVSQSVVPYLQQAVQAVQAGPHYGVDQANVADGGVLHISLLTPRAYDQEEYFKVKNKFKELVTGKTLVSADGKPVPVKSVNVTGVTV